MKKFLFQILIFLLAFFCWKIFAFSHPYPKEILNSIFCFLFCSVLLGYLVSLRLGRILLVFLALSSTRMTSLAFNREIDLITNTPVFLGGIFGLFLRCNLNNYPKANKLDSRFSLNNSGSGLKMTYKYVITFLLVLILDRFLVYYDFPFINQVGFQELLYTPRFTSKMAFAFSSEIFVGLVLPLLYFLSEEFCGTSKLKQDFTLGVLLTLFINGIVIGIQTYINIYFFSFQTNSSPTFGRATGLFRDAGSASFIFPSMFIFLFQFLESWKFKQKIFLFPIFLVGVILLGKSLGRAYWILLILAVLYFSWYKFKSLNKKLGFFIAVLLLFVVFSFRTFLYRNPDLLPNLINGNFVSLDPHRFFLNKVAWYSFIVSPIFGNGIGSFPTFLDDPTHVVSNREKIIDNPMFFFGLLNDVGTLGILFLCAFLICLSFYFKNLLGIWILFSSFIVGYHISHPDSAFWLLLMITYLNFKKRAIPLRWVKVINIFFPTILILFIMKTVFKLQTLEPVPLFRYEVNQKYQLQAFNVNQKEKVGEREYLFHNFLGSVIWKIQPNSGSLRIHIFLSNFTKKESLSLKASFLDKSYNEIFTQVFTIHKWQIRPINFLLTNEVEFLRLDELSEDGKLERFGKHIYSVSQKNFNEKNELRDIEGIFD